MPRLGSGVRIASPAPFGTEKAASSDAAFRFSLWPPALRTKTQRRANKFTQFSIFLLQPLTGLPKSRLTEWQRGRSSGVEHNLAKVRVGRSNRLARSIRNRKGHIFGCGLSLFRRLIPHPPPLTTHRSFCCDAQIFRLQPVTRFPKSRSLNGSAGVAQG